MTAYALGLSFVMLIMAAATTLALMVLRIDYYYVLGPIAGLAILLPYVGVILSTIPAVAVAFFQYDGEKALLVLLVYSLLQFLEGNVLTPYIVGGKVTPLPADGHDRVHLLGHDLGRVRSRPRRPSDLRDQGRLRARPRAGRAWRASSASRTCPTSTRRSRANRPPKQAEGSQGAGGRLANLRSIAR